MRTFSEGVSSARGVGNNGCDALKDGQLVYATQWPNAQTNSKGWYGFYCTDEVVITDVVFLDKGGNALALTPTWEDFTLPAGCWVPAGYILGEDAYISSITCTGSILLYID